MGNNGGEHIKISGSDAAECSQTTVQIKIKMLDSQIFTLRVDKCVIYITSDFLLTRDTYWKIYCLVLYLCEQSLII